MTLDLIDMRTIDDEIKAGTARARLQRLVPQWLIRNLPHDTLRHNLLDVLGVSRDFLKPILDLWYPHALDGVSFGPEISALLNADVDTSLVTLAGNGRRSSTRCLTPTRTRRSAPSRPGSCRSSW